MHAFKRARGGLSIRTLVSLPGKRHDALVGDVAALDKANPLELGERRELFNRLVRQILTAGEINVADTSAHPNQLLDTSVGNPRTVAKVDVVEVLAKLRDRRDGTVGDLTAFCQDEVTQAWGGRDDLLDTNVVELSTIRKIQYAEALICSIRRQVEEGVVRDAGAVR